MFGAALVRSRACLASAEKDQMARLSDLLFDNKFVESLPGDSEKGTRLRAVDAAFALVDPTPVEAPSTIAVSHEVLDLIGLDQSEADSAQFAAVFSGNEVLPGMEPFAMSYGGHQFGNWAGQLGDGRAIALGEVVNGDDRYTLQLKGAGPTPFSRSADGRAVLRSSIREFLCSEAMFHLGIPTTRALSLVETGDKVLRDMFYDGNAANEKGAVVCRVSKSFIRFGSFELPSSRQNIDMLRALADFVIDEHYPARHDDSGYDYAGFFGDVVTKTADVIVEWLRVGFVHGVLNTDNMSIIGETIDYGPYGWLDNFDTGWTPNTTDASGKRYRYGNQAAIGQWNLLRLANALFPLTGDPEPLTAAMDTYATRYNEQWSAMMAAKLGLVASQDPEPLIDDLIDLLSAVETDYTIFFRALSDHTAGPGLAPALAAALYGGPESLDAETAANWTSWFERYEAALALEPATAAERKTQMDLTNPKFVLRNYLSQQAIDAADAGDYRELHALHEVIRAPYDEQPGNERFAEKRPEWARSKAGCSMLSCSS